ncbi:MAG: NADH-quinone oxidoreductase subunit M [Phycisphaerales bacterium]
MTAALLILIPLVAAVAAAIAPSATSRWVALLGSLALFAHAVIAAMFFGAWGTDRFALTSSVAWLPQFGINLSFGADSVSMALIVLNCLLLPLCVFGSFTAITQRQREYYAWMLGLAAAVNGVFLARDLIVFYTCFEFTLVPLYFLIAIYGGPNRERASIKFFLFTFTGSLITLAGLLYVAWQYALSRSGAATAGAWTFDIATLTRFAAAELSAHQQAMVLLALMAGFAVKVPLFPVHTWLPLAHTEAPTAGSVLLAGVLLKLGTYGIYRFVLPMVPEAVVAYAPFIAVLSIIGILYAALICWVQDDVKRLVAYSSVSHLGFCVLGMMALNPVGVQGSVLYMINHGLSTGALFLCIGMIYERFHTRDMDAMSGLARRMPVWAFFMVFFTLASVGLPGLNGFVSEFLCLVGTFAASPDAPTGDPGVLGPWYAAAAGVGMILAAMYLLIMLGKVVFGPLRVPGGAHGEDGTHAADHGGAGRATAARAGAGSGARDATLGHGDDHAAAHSVLPVDLSVREITILVPLAVLCLALGFAPRFFTDAVAGSIAATLKPYPSIVANHETASLPEPARD